MPRAPSLGGKNSTHSIWTNLSWTLRWIHVLSDRFVRILLVPHKRISIPSSPLLSLPPLFMLLVFKVSQIAEYNFVVLTSAFVRGYRIIGFIRMRFNTGVLCGISCIELSRVLRMHITTQYIVRPHSLRYGYTDHPFGSECPNILHSFHTSMFVSLRVSSRTSICGTDWWIEWIDYLFTLVELRAYICRLAYGVGSPILRVFTPYFLGQLVVWSYSRLLRTEVPIQLVLSQYRVRYRLRYKAI